MKAIFIIISILVITLKAQTQEVQWPLEAFLEAAKKESPDLMIEKSNLEVASARANGIRLSPTMVGYMQMKEGKSTQNGYEISQEIPFPTKLSYNKKVRNLELETQKELSQYQQTMILNEARNAYLEFWSTYEKVQILKNKYHWLKHHVDLTRSSTRSDSLAQVHLLEVETDRDLMENEVLALDAELVEKRNALRIYAPSLKMDLLIPQEPSMPSIAVEKSERALVALKEKELTVLEVQEELKKQSYTPDFLLRLRSYNSTAMTPSNQEIMVGVTLPFLFFWQPKSEVAEASAQKMKAQAELQKAKTEFEIRIFSLSKKADSIKAQINNLKDKLIPRAEKRKKLVTNISPRTMEGLNEHKSVFIGYLDLRIKAIDLRMDYENTLKEILKMTGVKSKEGIP